MKWKSLLHKQNTILASGMKKVIAASGDYLVYFHPLTIVSIWTLTDTTTPGQSELVSNGNERVLHIPQTLTGPSPSDAV